MKPVKRAIAELLEVVEGKNFEQAFDAVQTFYQNNLCLESHEWNRMTEKEKIDLINALLKYTNK